MTREEKQKAINALKISAPIMAITQEEFYDYIQTLNKIMDWLEQDTVSKESYDHEYFLRKEFEIEIDKLKQQIPKTGHLIRWYETIERENCTIHDPHCKCSECDQEYDPYNASLFNYCPNCGAKMEKED